MPRYYLGVDGGQSSTTTLLADETGRILGSGRGGPCNHVAALEAREKFLRAIGDSLAQACRQAQLDSKTVKFAAACLGFSGGAADKDALSRQAVRSERFKITHDAEIALSGALEAKPGIIVIAGTGSMAFGRDHSGRTARAGGWGYVFGDEGGAFDIFRRALRTALRSEEGWGPDTGLAAVLMENTGASSINELMHRFYLHHSRGQFASLAPLVSKLAEAGDTGASAALTEAAAALSAYVEGVYRNLFSPGEPVRIARIGGVFRSVAFSAAFESAVLKSTGCPTEPPRFYPAAGAVLEALRLDQNHSSLSSVPDLHK